MSGAGLIGRKVVNENLRVAQLADFVVLDGFVTQQIGDAIERLIGFRADRLLHLHLKNQVRSALQIEAQLDAVREIGLQNREGFWRVGNSDQANNTYKNDAYDEDYFPLEIRIHGLDWLRTP